MRGSFSRTARSGRSSSRAPPCSRATSCRARTARGPSRGRRSATGGWTPATSARSTPTATSGSRAGPRTSSSAAGTTSTRRRSRTRCSRTRRSSRPPPSGGRTRTPARCRWRTSRSPPAPPSTEDELRAWAAARAPEPAAAPKRVDVVDAIPLTAVGKVFKPELRRLAAEAAARDALAGIATDVAARLAEGQVVVTVRGGDRAAVRDALAPFAFDWENADQERNR